jgi:hypothetical protein
MFIQQSARPDWNDPIGSVQLTDNTERLRFYLSSQHHRLYSDKQAPRFAKRCVGRFGFNKKEST